MKLMNPTMNYQVGDVASIPVVLINDKDEVTKLVEKIICVHKNDWDSFETSWGFKKTPILVEVSGEKSLSQTYVSIRERWRHLLTTMVQLEKENNRIFIDAYGLHDELSPEVGIEDVTLGCNPNYRYGDNKTEAELEVLIKADTLREFISYAVGCMFGRYSLDKEGLILANQGDTLEEYLKQVPQPSFTPDDDNVIPMIDFEGDWFEDDISERFKQFIKISLGEENFSENLAFVEEAIGKDIKKYFAKDFYADHVKRYKKRPIYWLFSSPKGTFNALIYMHRYRPDTVSVVLNDYLREFCTKLQARRESYEQIEISASASQKDKTQAIKAMDKINKVLDEVNDYERDILYPRASQNIEIDLDNGVKQNYPLLGKALKKVTGLS